MVVLLPMDGNKLIEYLLHPAMVLINPNMYRHQMTRKNGFTLIELSIVLVIIGLIVGGVLVGKDLIAAASLRSTLSQYQEFNTATNTFKLKYTGLPGDLQRNTAVANGFITAPANYTNLSNGNGIIQENASTNLQISPPNGEILFFWRHLGDANLIAGKYSSHLVPNTGAYPGADGYAGSYNIGDFVPSAKIGNGVFWIVGTNGSENFFGLIAAATLASNGANYNNPNSNLALTPLEAANIDSKIDDGLPNIGKVQSRKTHTGINSLFNPASYSTSADLNVDNAANYAASATVGTCTTGGSSSVDAVNTYATNAVSLSTKACNLRLKLQ